jgi:hypothetical protein
MVISEMPKILENLGPGVMEYWSVEKEDINSLASTPLLQHSSTPMLRNYLKLKSPTIDYLLVGYRAKDFIDED